MNTEFASEIDWTKSDKHIRIEAHLRTFGEHKAPTIGEAFPELKLLRDSLNTRPEDVMVYFETSIDAMLARRTPPNYILKLIKYYPSEFDQALRNFFAKK